MQCKIIAISSLGISVKTNIQNNAYQYGLQLFVGSLAVNLNAAADVAILGSARFRGGIEVALQQVDILTHYRNPKAAAVIQQAYAVEVRKELAENHWVNVGLLVGNMQQNIDVVKHLLERAHSAQSIA